MTDRRALAADYLAAMTDAEYQAFAAEARNPERTRQLTRDELRGMKPEAILDAKNTGRLNAVLGIADPDPGTDQLTRADLARLSPEAIVKAKNDGRLNSLLGLAN